MPIYEYECSDCGRVHEILQKMSEKPLSKCPDCSGSLHKRISQCTFHLKGTGWYATDYANKSNTPSSSGSGDKKEESKPKETPEQPKPKDSGADANTKTSTSSSSSNSNSESGS
ncbi:MAG: zinc ribbon domain-containing protein [Desulfobacteraceae bacterium]|nr:zinc ribbon domain-containing protein [Desulfobacteraceae bacterium]